MFFSEIIGQKTVKEKLLLSVQQNRVSHSQLFIGPEGNGSLPLALAYAQYLNCENKLDNARLNDAVGQDSCGKCPSCIKSQKMIHPDIHFSFPVFKLKSGSENPALSSDFIKPWREAVLANPYQNLSDWLDFIDAENKQGNISADECRLMIHDLSMKTYESKHKVMIIWMAEQLGKEGNILLKLLEEPPPNTLLILIAENRDQLLPTILSRCQIISIPRLSDDDLLDALMNKHGLHRDAATKIVRQSEGNYREALQIVNSSEDDQFEFLKKWMQLLVSNKPEVSSKELVEWVDDAAKLGREKQKSFFRFTLEFFRECIILQQAGEEHSNLLDEEKRMALWLTQRLSSNDWQQLEKWIEEAHYHIERNAHPKILFMNLSLRLQKLIANKKLILTA
jgi:DNA polymerase-3 subunit delta'